jgi:hypothetical protein
LLGSGFHGLGEDGTRIVIIENHDVFVAFARDNGESTRLIGENLTGYVNHKCIHKIGSDLGFQRRRKGRHDR